MTFDEAIELLNNWGEWSREKKSQRTCGSAEGKYRAPQDNLDQVPHGGVQVRDAVKVDIIIRKLPARHKWLLVGTHVYGRGYVAENDVVLQKFTKRKGFAFPMCEQILEHKRAVQMVMDNYRATY